ncbi:MAG: AMP-binding protein [Chloroflexi bacterium]|nr:AMP-binding protein [Chloroflexota bacterium]MCC6892182.1 AMP-binding protein [Anaerolineae bacterium]
MNTSPVVWQPTPEYIENAAFTRFMRQHGIPTYEALLEASDNIEWFWNAFIQFANIEFYTPYSQTVDLSEGLPFPKWFVGGEINIAHNALDKWAANLSTQNNLALIWESEAGDTLKFSFHELWQKANQVANALRALGIQRGERVGIFMPLIPETVMAVFGIYKIGAVVVPLFSGFGHEAIALRLNDVGATAVVTADGFYRSGKWQAMKTVLDRAVEHVPSIKHVLFVERGDNAPLVTGRDHVWQELVDSQPNSFETVHTQAEEICMVSYSSGTSGKPKGVVQVHGGVAVKSAEFGIFNYDLHQGDLIHQITDFGWMMGQAPMLRAYSAGAALMLYEGSPTYPTASRMFELIQKHRITVFGAPATALRIFKTQVPDAAASHDLSSIRMLTHTGEPIDTDTWMWYFKWTKGRAPVINVSGGTELFAEIVATSFMQPIKPTCLGLTPAIHPIIVDEHGQPVQPNTSGYLCFTLPQPAQTRGFWREDDTRYLNTYFPHGNHLWWHGDMVMVDGDGFWFHQGRADDVLKVAGRRTGPGEIEDVVGQIEGVHESAAIGIPHPLKGEEIIVFVVPKPETTLNPAAVIKRVSDGLGKPYEPSAVYLVSDLPKTRSGKVIRRLIKQRYLGEPDGDVSSLHNPEALDGIPRKNT